MPHGLEARDEGREQKRLVEPRIAAARRPRRKRAGGAAPLEHAARRHERGPDRVPAFRMRVEQQARPVRCGLGPRDQMRRRDRRFGDKRLLLRRERGGRPLVGPAVHDDREPTLGDPRLNVHLQLEHLDA